MLRELGEVDQLRRRHAEHYLGFAEQAHLELRGAGQARWLAALDSEHTNLRASIEYVRGAGEKELELRFVARALVLLDRARPPDRGHDDRGARARGLRPRQAPLPAGRRAAERWRRSRTGWATRAGRRCTRRRAIGLYREVGDLGGEAAALTTLAGAALVEGDGTRARELYEQALDSTRNLNDPFRLASALGNLGYLLLMEGDNERAGKLFEEGLIVFRRLSSEEGVARSLLNLGFAALAAVGVRRGGRADEGEPAAVRDHRSREGIAYCLEGLAAVAASEETACGRRGCSAPRKPCA